MSGYAFVCFDFVASNRNRKHIMDRSSLSPLEYLPLTGPLEKTFNARGAVRWLHDNFHVTLVSSGIYVAFIVLGTRWMKNRAPFGLGRTLFLWNVALAAFSIIGSFCMFPRLLFWIYEKGLPYTTCRSGGVFNPHTTLWAFLFVISKIFELGDTVFIVLRKKKLMFLHWYHHITVLMFSWYCLGNLVTGLGHWFAGVNLVVHSVMYTYYAVASYGIRVPSRIAFWITVFQLTQMFVGLAMNLIAYFYRSEYIDCHFDMTVFKASMLMYASYALLFGWYFLNRYIKRRP